MKAQRLKAYGFNVSFIFLHSNKENKILSPLPSMPPKKLCLFELKKKSLKLPYQHILKLEIEKRVNMDIEKKKKKKKAAFFNLLDFNDHWGAVLGDQILIKLSSKSIPKSVLQKNPIFLYL